MTAELGATTPSSVMAKISTWVADASEPGQYVIDDVAE
jgi:hypothetical protein